MSLSKVLKDIMKNKRLLHKLIKEGKLELVETSEEIAKSYEKKSESNIMDIILLPGNSQLNKDWINEVANALKPDFKKVFTHYYSHWNLEKEEILDLKKELDSILIYSKKSPEYYIFAKSAGIILALKAINQSKLSPKKCIFVGFPLNWARKNNLPLENALNNLKIPSLFIQKTNDPTCSFKNLKKILASAKVKNCSLIEISGDDHHYENISFLRSEIKRFLRSNCNILY